MIYGWGRKNKSWPMPDGRQLVAEYNYGSVLFIFKVAWKRTYTIIGRDRAMDQKITREELEKVYGDGNVPDIGLFERFGVFFAMAGIIVFAVLFSIVQSIGGGGESTTETASDPVAAVVSPVDDEVVEQEQLTDSTVAESRDDAADSEEASAASETADADAGATDAPAEADEAADDQDAAAAVGADDVGDEDGAVEAATPAVVYQEATDIVLVSDTDFASTNLNSPTQGWAQSQVHGAFATTAEVREVVPAAGEKIVAIEYQLINVTSTLNVQSPAFRLITDELAFAPLNRINELINGGDVINTTVYFSVPVDAIEFRYEMGPLDPLADGFQAAYEFTLTDAEPPADPVRYDAPDAEHTAVLVSDSNVAAGASNSPGRAGVEVEVLGVTTTARIEANAADPGFKFVMIEIQTTAIANSSNVQTGAFRLSAGGEIYGPARGARINDLINTGDILRVTMPFEVPADVEAAELIVGAPRALDEGLRAVFQIDLSN